MKKAMKKLMAALLAVAMVCAMAIPAWAAPATNGSITVKNTVDGKTYNIYKILDLETNGTGDDASSYTAFKYKATTEWKSFVDSSAYLKHDADGYVTWKDTTENAADIEAFSKAAMKFAENLSPVASQVASSTGTVTFTGLELGYYLITSNVDTSSKALCMLSTTKPSATVQEKNGAPSVEKEVKENSTGKYGKVNDADIGDTVEFKTTINVTDGNPIGYILHDTMSAGLALNRDSIKVAHKDGADLTLGTDYTVAIPGIKDECTFEIHFVDGKLKTNDVIEVTYSAQITKDAVIAGSGNPNETILDYNNKTSNKSTTTTYVWQFDILKYTSNTDSTATNPEIPLAGAKFIVYSGSGETAKYAQFGSDNKFDTWVTSRDDATVLTTPADGKIALTGLDSGTYSLEEIEAPKGYNKLTAPITFTITNASDTAKKGTVSYTSDGTPATGTIKVLNNAGTTLPGTGGIGTTIFYVIGGGLMVAAAILLITKKRMENR